MYNRAFKEIFFLYITMFVLSFYSKSYSKAILILKFEFTCLII